MSILADCKLCKGLGMIQYEKDGIDFARPCACHTKRSIKENTPEKYQIPWNPEGYDLDWIKTGVDFLKSERRTMLLWGETRVGKTFLAYKIRNMYARKMGVGVTEYIRTTALRRNLHLCVKGGAAQPEEYRRYLKWIDADFVIIDDFWASPSLKTADFLGDSEAFFDDLKAKKIIITTNEDPGDEDNKIGGSIFAVAPTTYGRFTESAEWHEIKKEVEE